jgi:uncharacterized protein YqeY
MSLVEQVSEELKTAMKEKDAVKLRVLRVLKSEVQRNEQSVTGKVVVNDADVVKIVKKFIEGVKTTTNNQDEISVLESYLPTQLSESEIKLVITKVAESGALQIGDFMKHFKMNYDGRYDGKVLSNLIKEVLLF